MYALTAYSTVSLISPSQVSPTSRDAIGQMFASLHAPGPWRPVQELQDTIQWWRATAAMIRAIATEMPVVVGIDANVDLVKGRPGRESGALCACFDEFERFLQQAQLSHRQSSGRNVWPKKLVENKYCKIKEGIKIVPHARHLFRCRIASARTMLGPAWLSWAGPSQATSIRAESGQGWPSWALPCPSGPAQLDLAWLGSARPNPTKPGPTQLGPVWPGPTKVRPGHAPCLKPWDRKGGEMLPKTCPKT